MRRLRKEENELREGNGGEKDGRKRAKRERKEIEHEKVSADERSERKR